MCNMKFRNQPNYIALGLVLMVFANLTRLIFRGHVLLSEAWIDAISGLFYGMSFAILLGSIWKQRRSQRPSDGAQ